jgi:hypothetical protein
MKSAALHLADDGSDPRVSPESKDTMPRSARNAGAEHTWRRDDPRFDSVQYNGIDPGPTPNENNLPDCEVQLKN